jgi:hypothetical protein
MALGHVFSENFGFPCQSTFHLLLHNHLHYHPRLVQQARSGRSANSLTNQIKKRSWSSHVILPPSYLYLSKIIAVLHHTSYGLLPIPRRSARIWRVFPLSLN